MELNSELDRLEKYRPIESEYQRALKKHPNWPDDLFRQIAIVNEEAGEATKAVLHFFYELFEPDILFLNRSNKAQRFQVLSPGYFQFMSQCITRFLQLITYAHSIRYLPVDNREPRCKTFGVRCMEGQTHSNVQGLCSLPLATQR